MNRRNFLKLLTLSLPTAAAAVTLPPAPKPQESKMSSGFIDSGEKGKPVITHITKTGSTGWAYLDRDGLRLFKPNAKA